MQTLLAAGSAISPAASSVCGSTFGLTRADRSRVEHWLEQMEKEIRLMGKHLGIRSTILDSAKSAH
jgi:hypothetical protein